MSEAREIFPPFTIESSFNKPPLDFRPVPVVESPVIEETEILPDPKDLSAQKPVESLDSQLELNLDETASVAKVSTPLKETKNGTLASLLEI